MYRSVHVNDVGQVSRQRRRDDGRIVGFLRKLFDDNRPIRLRRVEVLNDAQQDCAFFRVASAVIPQAELGLRACQATECEQQQGYQGQCV